MAVRDSLHFQQLNSSYGSVKQLYVSSSTSPKRPTPFWEWPISPQCGSITHNVWPDATIAKYIDYSSAVEEVILFLNRIPFRTSFLWVTSINPFLT